jgi:2-amino-4-hydroxy-6-hydroxymethyldihydropteridine diphosphokinase
LLVFHAAYISVGSNLGCKLSNCQKAIALLSVPGETRLKRQSGFYATEPVDYLDQDWFVNAVIEIETTLEPHVLLKKLKMLESELGRTAAKIRFGPRVIDLDIIFYDDLILSSRDLILPHPRMHKRRFVLQPICDIDQKIFHPVLKKDVHYLLDRLDEDEQRIFPYPCDC